jgi:hypothetical protein
MIFNQCSFNTNADSLYEIECSSFRRTRNDSGAYVRKIKMQLWVGVTVKLSRRVDPKIMSIPERKRKKQLRKEILKVCILFHNQRLRGLVYVGTAAGECFTKKGLSYTMRGKLHSTLCCCVSTSPGTANSDKGGPPFVMVAFFFTLLSTKKESVIKWKEL